MEPLWLEAFLMSLMSREYQGEPNSGDLSDSSSSYKLTAPLKATLKHKPN